MSLSSPPFSSEMLQCQQNQSDVPYTDHPLSFPPPVVPPAEDVDRYRRRFNMRMLVPGRPVKESPATPPPVPTDRPTYREKFIPPELSMWDYFVAKVRRSSRCVFHHGSFLIVISPSALPAPVRQQRSVWFRRKWCRGGWRRRRRLPLWHSDDGALGSQLLQVFLGHFGFFLRWNRFLSSCVFVFNVAGLWSAWSLWNWLITTSRISSLLRALTLQVHYVVKHLKCSLTNHSCSAGARYMCSLPTVCVCYRPSSNVPPQ